MYGTSGTRLVNENVLHTSEVHICVHKPVLHPPGTAHSSLSTDVGISIIVNGTSKT